MSYRLGGVRGVRGEGIKAERKKCLEWWENGGRHTSSNFPHLCPMRPSAPLCVSGQMWASLAPPLAYLLTNLSGWISSFQGFCLSSQLPFKCKCDGFSIKCKILSIMAGAFPTGRGIRCRSPRPLFVTLG